MPTKTSLMLFSICTLATNVAYAQGSLVAKHDPKRTFLEPLEPTRPLRAGDPRMPQFCATSDRVQCPPLVSSRALPGGAGMPDDFGQALPHVRVSFYVDEIRNEIVANGGADVSDIGLLRWETTSSEAVVENGGPYHWTVPEPGQAFVNVGQYGHPSGLMIYDALVFNACGPVFVFQVDHEGTIEAPLSTPIGSFQESDTSTIDSPGYYNLSYTIRAEDENGGVSDFRIEGVVAAICSGLNSL